MTSNHLQEFRSIHDSRVSLHVEDATLKDVLQQLEPQMGLRFMYNNEAIEESLHRFSLDIESSSAADILRNISARTVLSFRQINGMISIGTAHFRQAEPDEEQSQQEDQVTVVIGMVSDGSTGETIHGVNVIVVGLEEVAGNTIGTQSNVDGDYYVRVPECLNTLRFSFIGLQPVDVHIGGGTRIGV